MRLQNQVSIVLLVWISLDYKELGAKSQLCKPKITKLEIADKKDEYLKGVTY
jgi:hypothetical protein